MVAFNFLSINKTLELVKCLSLGLVRLKSYIIAMSISPQGNFYTPEIL